MPIRNLLLRLMVLAASVLFLAAPGATRTPVRHRHGPVDWTRTVAATPEGGFRIGNPRAKVAVIEFMSFTCPHCGAFAAGGFPVIRDKYVRSGKVSFEMRSALRDRADLVAATLAQCAGQRHFFDMAEALFAAQSDWEIRAIDWDSGHPAPFDGPDGPAAMTAFAAGTGLDLVARQHGVPASALPGCFADAAVRANLTRSTAEAWGSRKINGTPAFLINGVSSDDVHDWSMLEPLLQNAVKG
ncbi:MAG TPA: thioredoxin domain-containing protein [Sphingomonas sp.]